MSLVRTLREIWIHPVKSLAGVATDVSDVEPWGLRHDRRWVLVNPDGTVLTARSRNARHRSRP